MMACFFSSLGVNIIMGGLEGVLGMVALEKSLHDVHDLQGIMLGEDDH